MPLHNRQKRYNFPFLSVSRSCLIQRYLGIWSVVKQMLKPTWNFPYFQEQSLDYTILHHTKPISLRAFSGMEPLSILWDYHEQPNLLFLVHSFSLYLCPLWLAANLAHFKINTQIFPVMSRNNQASVLCPASSVQCSKCYRDLMPKLHSVILYNPYYPI